MTKKLYDQNPHLQTFQAQVLSCTPSDTGYQIVLDQTAFFPGGGGQACDRGYLDSSQVLEITEKDGIIYHQLSKPIAPGTKITGRIDWKFRFTNMQQHSGEHILSGVIHAMKGYDNVGFHMNDSFTTVDFNGPLTLSELEEAERRANQVIYENVPVLVFYPSSEQLAHMSYRSKKELTGPVRIVQVGNTDFCACCAPHVSQTGEVGIIKIISQENYKGGVRLTILCGARALSHYHQQTLLLHQFTVQLSAPQEKLIEMLNKQAAEKKQLKASVMQLSEELIQSRILQLSETANPICLIEPSLDTIAARQLINRLSLTHSGYIAVLLPQENGSFHYLISSQTQDLQSFCSEWNHAFQGRGGGSSQMIQGTVWGNPEEMKKFIENRE